MAKRENGYKQTEASFGGVSLEDAKRIVGLSHEGKLKTREIAAHWQISPGDVVEILAQAGYDDGLSPMVKRLTKDPEDLCCMISGSLYENPVVLHGDGETYEKDDIQRWTRNNPTSPKNRKRLPTPVQLVDNKDMVSKVSDFKQETVAEVDLIAPFLLKIEAFEALKTLLDRAETFVRPDLNRDVRASSARKQLFKLLVLRWRMPGTGEEAWSALSASLQETAPSEMQGLLSGIEVSELRVVLSELTYETIERLRSCSLDGNCRDWVNRELACRLVIGLDDDSNNDHWFRKLWQVLLQNAVGDGSQEWSKAAAVVLATFTDRVTTDTSIKDVASRILDILDQACDFLENKDQAIAFAMDFFKNDLGISGHIWPPASSARILEEMASRRAGQTRLEFLVLAHTMFPSDVPLRRMLVSELHDHILQLDAPSAGAGLTFDLEDLFVKLVLEEEGEIPGDVLQKLTLKDEYLQHFKGDLMFLVQQLREVSRFADAARVAVAFAQNLANTGKKEEAEHAFLLAFRLDPTNAAAASGLVDLAKQVMQMMGEWPNAATAAPVPPGAVAASAACPAIHAAPVPPGAVAASAACPAIHAAPVPPGAVVASAASPTPSPAQSSAPAVTAGVASSEASAESLLLDWNLAGIDFTQFNDKGESSQESKKFEIKTDLRAWITIYLSKDIEPRCKLSLNRPADVKLRVRAGQFQRTLETDSFIRGRTGERCYTFSLGSRADLEAHMTVHVLST